MVLDTNSLFPTRAPELDDEGALINSANYAEHATYDATHTSPDPISTYILGAIHNIFDGVTTTLFGIYSGQQYQATLTLDFQKVRTYDVVQIYWSVECDGEGTAYTLEMSEDDSTYTELQSQVPNATEKHLNYTGSNKKFRYLKFLMNSTVPSSRTGYIRIYQVTLRKIAT